MDKDKLSTLKVVVIGGGWSEEREISLASAAECQQALLTWGFTQVDKVDLADPELVAKLIAGAYDVAFLALHGRFGEDGCIQGLLEILRIPYTFSGVAASAVTLEKHLAKAIYEGAGLRVPHGVDLDPQTEATEELIDTLIDTVGLPAFVKPANNGSSFGVSRVSERAQFAAALELASSFDSRILVEEGIEGTEIAVPVIGNAEPQALPIIEIVTGAEFYDNKVKYEPSSLHHVIPARLEAGVYARAQELACRAHQALGCRGCSRSDFIVTADGDPVILETNTIPGMTEASLLPDSARHGGVPFPELCARLIALAVEDVDSNR